MRQFTPKEKQLIVNTSITIDCFEMDNFENIVDDDITLSAIWFSIICDLEQLRKKYLKEKDERYFTELIRMLPNSYKVVKL